MFFYAGQGQLLRQALAGTGNATFQGAAPDTTIDAGAYTESVAAHDCVELMFNMTTDANSTASVDIETSSTSDFAINEVYESVPFNGRNLSWSAGKFLTGFFRVKNGTTANLSVFVQKRIR